MNGAEIAHDAQGARSLAEYGGVNVHAQLAIDGRERKRLEHVLRYMARSALALDRLALRAEVVPHNPAADRIVQSAPARPLCIGACVQVDSYDTSRLRNTVEHRDVGVPLRATSYELPDSI